MHHSNFNTQDDADDFVEKMKGFMGGDHNNSMMILEGTF